MTEMIDMTICVWLAIGLLAGFMHAMMLWRTAHRFTAWTPVLGLLRLAVVAVVLIVAALSGAILSAAAGWAIGFVVPGMWFVMFRANRVIASPRAGSSE